MGFPVTEHLGNFVCSRKGTDEAFLWDLVVRKVMPLSIQGLNDFIKAHEITYEWQMLTIACLVRVCECAGHDIAEFVDVAHVNDPQCRINP